MKKCPYCGNMCDDKNKHCTVCGTSLIPKVERSEGLINNNAFSIIIYIILGLTLASSVIVFIITLIPLFTAYSDTFSAYLLLVLFSLSIAIVNVVALGLYNKCIRDFGYVTIVTFILLVLSNPIAFALALLDKEHRM